MELRRYRARVQLVHNVLVEECGTSQTTRERREVLSTRTEAVEIEKQLYKNLLQMLAECRRSKSNPTTDSNSLTPKNTMRLRQTTHSLETALSSTAKDTRSRKTDTTPTKTTRSPNTNTTPTSTVEMATATAVDECLLAINLTEIWRVDHNGNGLRRKDGQLNCDTEPMVKQGRPWFRFSGAAGNRLLDSCPPINSCGTIDGMWSDEVMPKRTGEIRVINVFASAGYQCKRFTYKLKVKKCSRRRHDYIYRYLGDSHCYLSFCGMM